MEIHGFRDTIKWYDDNAEQYEKNSKQVSFESVVDDFLEKLPVSPAVLDAGCGTGRETRLFHEKGATVIGVDISKGLLEVARRENSDVEFIEANFADLPLTNQLFDGVWSHASLVHLESIGEVKAALSEFHRVLKPGGFLYVYVKEQLGEQKTAVVSDSLSEHDRFFRYYESAELNSLLRDAGFTVGELEHTGDSHGRIEVKWLRTVVQKPVE